MVKSNSYSIILSSLFSLTQAVGIRTALESPVSSELNEEEESPEPDGDYYDEYDSDEERRQKKKRRPAPKTRSMNATTVTATTTRSNRMGVDSDKPFLCNGQC